MFAALDESIVKRARERGLLTLRGWDIREFAYDRHRKDDDTPYGGGAGMVMKPRAIHRARQRVKAGPARPGRRVSVQFPPGRRVRRALQHVKAVSARPARRVILMSPQGRRFDQALARELAAQERLIFICGRYEGVDERVRLHLVSDEISIGDYVLTGGELPAMVVID